MVIRKFGLEIKELEREDLELIRQYRNTESIKKRMIYKSQITREQHLKWFEEIQSIRHFYFLIYKGDVALGLINGKNINFEEGSSEGGIFVWNEDRNYETSITASIILNDWNFLVNGFQINYAQVLKSNKKAIAYNEFMGYKIDTKQHDNPEVVWMSQSKEDYLQYRDKIQKLSFEDFNITERVTEDDVFFQKSELSRAKVFLEKLPLKQKEVYQRILNRAT